MLKKSAGKPCRFLNVKMVDKYGYDMYNICMNTIRFEWDENKNIISSRKATPNEKKGYERSRRS